MAFIPGFDQQKSNFGTELLNKTRMAQLDAEKGIGDSALIAQAYGQIADNQRKMKALGVEASQPKDKGFGIGDALNLGMKGLSIAGGLGAFSGGGGLGGAENYSPTGAPGLGATDVDWMSMPGYFGNPG